MSRSASCRTMSRLCALRSVKASVVSENSGTVSRSPMRRRVKPMDPAPIMAAGEAAARASAVAAAPTASQAAGAGNQITIGNFAFAPKVLKVVVGQTVTWANHDDVPHRIQSANSKFPSSGVLDTKATYGTKFSSPGEYPYYCSIHPTMTARIVVG